MFGERTIVKNFSFATRLLRAFWITAMVLCLAFAAWAAMNRLGEQISAAGTHGEIQTVIVRPGDTVWTIAQRHGPSGWDVRKKVEAIRSLNGLENGDLGNLQPGQVIKVPTR